MWRIVFVSGILGGHVGQALAHPGHPALTVSHTHDFINSELALYALLLGGVVILVRAWYRARRSGKASLR